jgi:hypothetical protein
MSSTNAFSSITNRLQSSLNYNIQYSEVAFPLSTLNSEVILKSKAIHKSEAILKSESYSQE